MSSLRDADEWELVDRARKALGKAAMLPLGSTARAIQWTAYETLKAELDRRAVAVIREFLATPGAVKDDAELLPERDAPAAPPTTRDQTGKPTRASTRDSSGRPV